MHVWVMHYIHAKSLVGQEDFKAEILLKNEDFQGKRKKQCIFKQWLSCFLHLVLFFFFQAFPNWEEALVQILRFACQFVLKTPTLRGTVLNRAGHGACLAVGPGMLVAYFLCPR